MNRGLKRKPLLFGRKLHRAVATVGGEPKESVQKDRAKRERRLAACIESEMRSLDGVSKLKLDSADERKLPKDKNSIIFQTVLLKFDDKQQRVRCSESPPARLPVCPPSRSPASFSARAGRSWLCRERIQVSMKIEK